MECKPGSADKLEVKFKPKLSTLFIYHFDCDKKNRLYHNSHNIQYIAKTHK